MITIADILEPTHIDLSIGDVSQQAAVLHLMMLLKHDPRIRDWNQLYAEVRSRNPCVAEGKEFEICIPHARTDAVSQMVMAVGRSTTGIEGEDRKYHYIFVIGVPAALAADYLRIIGALARIFRDPDMELELRSVTDPRQFIEMLAEREMRL